MAHGNACLWLVDSLTTSPDPLLGPGAAVAVVLGGEVVLGGDVDGCGGEMTAAAVVPNVTYTCRSSGGTYTEREEEREGERGSIVKSKKE